MQFGVYLSVMNAINLKNISVGMVLHNEILYTQYLQHII